MSQKEKKNKSHKSLKKKSAVQIGQQQLSVKGDLDDDLNPNSGESHRSYQETNKIDSNHIQPGSSLVNPPDVDGGELKDANNTISEEEKEEIT